MSGVVFLVNPASANGSTGRRWPQVAETARALGLEGEALISSHPGEIADLAEQAADAGARLIVAVGGDGTVNEVAIGLLRSGRDRSGVELGVLPRGTGTDFVRTFGIPTRTDQALRVILDGTARDLDAGRVEVTGSSQGRESSYFVNVASAGMSGAVARRANASSKALGGKLSFLWATLATFARWRNVELELHVDGERRIGLYQDVIVANCRYLGGGMAICPQADPADGLFDVLLIGDITKGELVRTLPKLYRGTHLPHPKAELLRGRVVEVKAPAPLPVELDGEQPGTTPARFELLPAALRLRVPR